MKYFPKKQIIKVKTIGGELPSPMTLAPKLGPYGLSNKKISEDIAKKTSKNWKNILVMVYILAYKKSLVIRIKPYCSSLIKREVLKNQMEKNSNFNSINLNQLIKISKIIYKRSYAKTFIGCVKEVLGTCGSIKVLVENYKFKQFTKKV
uniref:Ribosomal protein L2 n=1 Tax=Amorphochlora amoebiformis TaxID=1561963 RepID=A0A0H5BR24_9EUKA|nr:ribosomal protein L2 [Amorphochlora amoebiformis]